MEKYSLEPWLSVGGIAKHLGISKETVYRWLEKRKIPAHRIGKLWKFKASEVDAWVINGNASESPEPSASAHDFNEPHQERAPHD